jgi:hypothetical protein
MPDAQTRTLDVYSIACLAGGPDRMIDTALVALVESGRVRVSAPGCLATASLVRRHPVEAAVLDAIGPSGNRSVDTVRWRLTADARILDVARRLRDAGLTGVAGALVPAGHRTRSRWRTAPTYAGRHVLHEFRDKPPTDDVAGSTSAMTVALHGLERMPDRALCASMFEPPPSAVLSGGTVKTPPDLEYADGWQAAHRTRDQIKADVARHAGWAGGWVPP